MLIGLSSTIPTLAETAPSITMENSGAYLFTWRPVDYGNGQSFAILVGGNTINESDVILNRGYDYGYTFQPNKYSRPWGQVPDLVNAGGVWAIPDNWSSLPPCNFTCLTNVFVYFYRCIPAGKCPVAPIYPNTQYSALSVYGSGGKPHPYTHQIQ